MTMELPTSKFKLGDVVYIVDSSAREPVKVPCPVCYTHRQVVLILGNGVHEKVVCSYCGPSIEPPSGYVTEYQPAARVVESTIKGMTCEYGYWSIVVGLGRTYQEDEGVIFLSREEAESKLPAAQQAVEEQSRRNFESRFRDGSRRFPWTVGYHRNQIKDLEHSLAWHRAKLLELKAEKTK